MHEESTSTAFVVEEIVPALSAGLGRLHRSPDKNESWVEKALGALQRSRPADYHRLCRRLGFAQRLSQMATLGPDEEAVMALGLFFNVVGADGAAAGKPSKPWSDYLLRNEDWLAACFEVVRAIDHRGWDEIGDRSAAVAKVATIFDEETVERNARPLQVIATLTEADTPIVRQIIPLLWSEEGQELCDHHFRRQERGYRLDGDSIREPLQLLKPLPARPAADAPAAPQRLSRTDKRTSPRRTADAAGSAEDERPENFQRRRQALRAGPGWGTLLGVPKGGAGPGRAHEPTTKDVPDTLREQATEDVRAEPREHATEDVPNILREQANWDITDEDEPRIAPSVPREEKRMSIRNISAARPDADGSDLVEKFEQVRSQFAQIKRIADEGQRALASLGPQLEEIASWMTEFETMVYRWRGSDSSDRAA
ncbi:MAG: hypothetical protein U1B78_07280 [Dehalococcoidia bacterium]|nr:hypothetical protein [Dehalococcoidia bacterium]